MAVRRRVALTSADVIEVDRVRDRHLRADGWEVIRFPVEELDDDDVARRIGAALHRHTRRPA